VIQIDSCGSSGLSETPHVLVSVDVTPLTALAPRLRIPPSPPHLTPDKSITYRCALSRCTCFVPEATARGWVFPSAPLDVASAPNIAAPQRRVVIGITGRERRAQPAASRPPTVRFSPPTNVEFTIPANTRAFLTVSGIRNAVVRPWEPSGSPLVGGLPEVRELGREDRKVAKSWQTRNFWRAAHSVAATVDVGSHRRVDAASGAAHNSGIHRAHHALVTQVNDRPPVHTILWRGECWHN
jgi:hypothetical protein